MSQQKSIGSSATFLSSKNSETSVNIPSGITNNSSSQPTRAENLFSVSSQRLISITNTVNSEMMGSDWYMPRAGIRIVVDSNSEMDLEKTKLLYKGWKIQQERKREAERVAASRAFEKLMSKAERFRSNSLALNELRVKLSSSYRTTLKSPCNSNTSTMCINSSELVEYVPSFGRSIMANSRVFGGSK